ncbi:MAG: protein phosphatase 2C domain-containing protein [Ktedonobacterales bacterium]
MVECIQCGATIRAGARFCNVCGARQTPQDASAPPVEEQMAGDTGAPSGVPDASGSSVGAAEVDEPEGSGGRLKRPPRVERTGDRLQGAGGDGSRAVATAVLPEDVGAEVARLAGGALPDVAESSAAAGAHDATEAAGVPVEEAETVESTAVKPYPSTSPLEYRGKPSIPLPETTAAANGVAHGDAPVWQPDGLPWPLPASMILGGRYRIEALVSAAPNERDGENVYRVSDLQGYEQCWSCGTSYGATGASDRFCRECGADMLAREFVMYERYIADGEDAGELAPAAETQDGGGETSTEEGGSVDLGSAGEASEGTGKTMEERGFTQGRRAYRVLPHDAEPSPFPQGARILIGAATDVGQSRSGERNEDSLAALVLNLGHDSHLQPLALGIVADGLGGHANGQDASRLVTRVLVEHIVHTAALPLIGLPADAQATADGLDAVLLEGARLANGALCAANTESNADMGSTLVAALLFDDTAYVLNAGDSRGYLLDGKQFRRITTDHSLVEQLVAGGLVTPEERYSHPQRNQIYRSLGDESEMQFDLFTQKLQPGMRLLLCSDGLWEMVRDDELARILGEAGDPQEACDELVRAANQQGGEDNVTAVVIEVRA